MKFWLVAPFFTHFWNRRTYKTLQHIISCTAVKKWHAAMFCMFPDSKSEWKKWGNLPEFHLERSYCLQNWYFNYYPNCRSNRSASKETLFLNQETKCLHSEHHHSLNNLRTPFRGYSGYICHWVFCFQNVQSSKTPTTISKVALVVTSSKMCNMKCMSYKKKGRRFSKKHLLFLNDSRTLEFLLHLAFSRLIKL